MKNSTIFLLAFIALLSNTACNHTIEPEKYEEANGIEYAIIYTKAGAFEIYVKDVEKYELEDIAKFCFCLSKTHPYAEGHNTILIESHFYYNTALWSDQPKANKVLYRVSFVNEGVEVEENTFKTVRKISSVYIRGSNGKKEKVSSSRYQASYECK